MQLFQRVLIYLERERERRHLFINDFMIIQEDDCLPVDSNPYKKASNDSSVVVSATAVTSRKGVPETLKQRL